MSAVGLKTYCRSTICRLYLSGNQSIGDREFLNLVTLSNGKYPVSSTIIRVPIGAYGGGGPYHSGSVETMLAQYQRY